MQDYTYLDNLPVGAGVWELGEPVRMLYANGELKERLGIGESELQVNSGLWSGELTQWEKKELEEVRRLPMGRVERRERLMVLRDKNGKPTWLRIFASHEGQGEQPTRSWVVVADVTQAKQLEEEHRRKGEVYQILLQRSDMMMFEYDLENDRMECSYPTCHGRREQMVQEGFSREAAVGGLVHPGDLPRCRRVLEQAMAGACQGELDYRGLNRLGTGYRWYRAFYNSIQGPEGSTQRLVGICMDVEEEKTLAAKLAEAATDGVSGLWNRAVAERQIASALREDRLPYACFLYDIDNFKQVNDNYGHQEGDRLLVRVAGVLRTSFRGSDIIGRLGGDEFVVLMRNLNGPESARERAEATVRAMEALSDGECCPLNISVSLGVAYDPCADHDFCQMYNVADQALYQAKRAGKNRHVFLEMDG